MSKLARKKSLESVNLKTLSRDVNRLSTKKESEFFNRYSKEELIGLRNRARKEFNSILIEKTTKAINKKSGLIGAELRAQNRKDIASIHQEDKLSRMVAYWDNKKVERIQKKMEKLEKKLNIKSNKMQSYTSGIIPSSQAISLGADKFIDRAVWINNRLPTAPKNKKDRAKGVQYRRPAQEVREISAKNYVKLMQEASKSSIAYLDKKSLSDVRNFSERYFKHGDSRKQAIINEYLKHMTIQDRLRVKDLLESYEFKKIYGSDEDDSSNGYNYVEDAGERAISRQDELISILKNETGLIIEADMNNKIVSKSSIKNHTKLKDKTFTNFGV